MRMTLPALNRIEHALQVCKSCGHSAAPVRLADVSYLPCWCRWFRMCEPVPRLRRDWKHNGGCYTQAWPSRTVEVFYR